MTDWERCLRYLPPPLAVPLAALPAERQEAVQEIRLYADCPVMLSTPRGLCPLPDGTVCTAAALDECVHRLCGWAVYAHQEELREGYIRTEDGLRVGVGGQAVVRDGAVQTVRAVTSLCLRVSRPHRGCADRLLHTLLSDRLEGVLLAGEPASGKTSLLRDLAAGLSEGRFSAPRRVAVVDERGELSAGNALAGCDVLLGCPKAEGISRAVRCLAPDVVVFDELGSPEETVAVVESLNAGVAAITSVHAGDAAALYARPTVRLALESGAFRHVVMLAGRHAPGRWTTVWDREENSHDFQGDRLVAGGDGVRRMGLVADGRAETPHDRAGSGGAADGELGTTPALHRRTASRSVAVGGWRGGAGSLAFFAGDDRPTGVGG